MFGIKRLLAHPTTPTSFLFLLNLQIENEYHVCIINPSLSLCQITQLSDVCFHRRWPWLVLRLEVR